MFPEDDLPIRVGPHDHLLQFHECHAVDLRLAEVQSLVQLQEVFRGGEFEYVHLPAFQAYLHLFPRIVSTYRTHQSVKRIPDFQFDIADVEFQQQIELDAAHQN